MLVILLAVLAVTIALRASWWTAAPVPEVTPTTEAPSPSEGRSDISIVDLKMVAQQLSDGNPGSTDEAKTFYSSRLASAHMHLIGTGQMCPLHIHRTTDEVTIIITGDPTVSHAWGEGSTASDKMPPHTLVMSPPFTGHEWYNDTGAPQANLVIGFPAFDGNLYLRPDDDRMREGKPPVVYSVSDELDEFEAGDAPVDEHTFNFMEGRFKRVLVREEWSVEPSDQHMIIYVASGKGELNVPTNAPLYPGILAVMRLKDGASLRVTEGTLGLYVFQPPVN